MAKTIDVSPLCDSFNSQASNYERRLGGSTRRVIEHIIPLLSGLPEGPKILDSACGPSMVTEAILKAYPNARVCASDHAPGMIALLDNLIDLNGWNDRVETEVMDGVSLSYASETFDASIVNFGIFFYSDPITGAKELYRTLKPGGKAVVTYWREVPFYPVLHVAQEVIKLGSKLIALSTLEHWTRRETIESTLKSGGFEDVETFEKEVMWWNEGIQEAAKGFKDSFVNMVGDQWAESEKEQLLGVTETLLTENKDGLVVKTWREDWVSYGCLDSCSNQIYEVRWFKVTFLCEQIGVYLDGKNSFAHKFRNPNLTTLWELPATDLSILCTLHHPLLQTFPHFRLVLRHIFMPERKNYFGLLAIPISKNSYC
ncbi:11ea30fa-702a-43c9-b928-d681fbe311dc [Sclerotinia trifoliorum]|uniref:11ea30fa-702a-43c9-b928-d681fbe311dc n=1 Tax=Sclerotinia trifoliorum TaxID=28548 RepID=A0A8H2VY54_9HELO|nr:11ea30fa-702a-43c9-b928-d681fbe311dc [Sclerotinia trifoliorum]